jgi:hypothetical protein
MYDRGPSPFPWRGVLTMVGYQGVVNTPVLVVGTTRVSWRIQALQPTRLAQRTLAPGERALVPHGAVRGGAAPSGQGELELRQVELFPAAAAAAPCQDCDMRALQGLNGKCDRHVTEASAGPKSRLAALRTKG